MASRSYKRDKNGRFAGSGTAVNTTVGRAGGFANSQHRTNVQLARAAKQSEATRGNTLNGAAGRILRSSAGRVATHKVGVAVGIASVGLAVRGAGKLAGSRNAKLARREAEMAQIVKALKGKRAVIARPGGGGSKSGRPSKRYASSSIRPPSVRLRASNLGRRIR